MFSFNKKPTVESNNRILKRLGLKTVLNKLKNEEFTDGERAIAACLRYYNINFIPEYVLLNLCSDTKEFRIADFYLPDMNIYIEFLGNWNSGPEHRKRYNQKIAVYKNNDIKCIFIFPNQLYNISKIIKERIVDYQNDLNWVCESCGKTFESKFDCILHEKRCFKFKCNICGSTFPDRVSFDSHAQKCYGWRCESCDKLFKTKKECLEHEWDCGGWSCERCGKIFSSKKECVSHEKSCGK
jgi:uncharacterized C2H2 Zn-finger protein